MILQKYLDGEGQHLSSSSSNVSTRTDVVETLNVATGQFLMSLLADQKLTQVDMQMIMKHVQNLVNMSNAVTIREVEALLKQHNCHHTHVLENLDARNIAPDLFHGLHTQHSQIKFFQDKFGLIMPITVKLPQIEEDFGRHRTRMDQHFRQQSYVRIPVLQQLEQYLNIDDVYYEVMEKPLEPSVPGLLSR